MSIVLYAKRFTCDGCQAAADIVEPFATPEGWTCVRGLEVNGLAMNLELCEICSATPFGRLMEILTAREIV